MVKIRPFQAIFAVLPLVIIVDYHSKFDWLNKTCWVGAPAKIRWSDGQTPGKFCFHKRPLNRPVKLPLSLH